MSLMSHEYRQQEERDNLSDAYMEDMIEKVGSLLNSKPGLTATFELTSVSEDAPKAGLATDILDLDTAKPVDDGAKELARLIGFEDGTYSLSLHEGILLGLAFRHAESSGRTITYEQQSGRLLASFGPRP